MTETIIIGAGIFAAVMAMQFFKARNDVAAGRRGRRDDGTSNIYDFSTPSFSSSSSSDSFSSDSSSYSSSDDCSVSDSGGGDCGGGDGGGGD